MAPARRDGLRPGPLEAGRGDGRGASFGRVGHAVSSPPSRLPAVPIAPSYRPARSASLLLGRGVDFDFPGFSSNGTTCNQAWRFAKQIGAQSHESAKNV